MASVVQTVALRYSRLPLVLPIVSSTEVTVASVGPAVLPVMLALTVRAAIEAR